jgi:tetratricopeptide (TPR) repeat protein
MGKYKSALASFENALKLAPQNLRYYFAIAVCHLKVGNSDLFDKTMQLISNHINDNNIYHEICIDGLSGNSLSGLNRLKSTVHEKEILPSFVRRDPILNLIFSPEQLETALQS